MNSRTDTQILSAEPVDVTLGGVVYKIAPPARKHCREFHKQLAEGVRGALVGSDFLSVFQGAKDIRAISFADVVPSLLAFLGSHADALLDLIYVYSPALAEAREAIEDSATTAEMLVALVACVRLEFSPFVPALSQIADLMGMTKTPAQTKNENGTPELPKPE